MLGVARRGSAVPNAAASDQRHKASCISAPFRTHRRSSPPHRRRLGRCLARRSCASSRRSNSVLTSTNGMKSRRHGRRPTAGHWRGNIWSSRQASKKTLLPLSQAVFRPTHEAEGPNHTLALSATPRIWPVCKLPALPSPSRALVQPLAPPSALDSLLRGCYFWSGECGAEADANGQGSGGQT